MRRRTKHGTEPGNITEETTRCDMRAWWQHRMGMRIPHEGDRCLTAGNRPTIGGNRPTIGGQMGEAPQCARPISRSGFAPVAGRETAATEQMLHDRLEEHPSACCVGASICARNLSRWSAVAMIVLFHEALPSTWPPPDRGRKSDIAPDRATGKPHRPRDRSGPEKGTAKGRRSGPVA